MTRKAVASEVIDLVGRKTSTTDDAIKALRSALSTLENKPPAKRKARKACSSCRIRKTEAAFPKDEWTNPKRVCTVCKMGSISTSPTGLAYTGPLFSDSSSTSSTRLASPNPIVTTWTATEYNGYDRNVPTIPKDATKKIIKNWNYYWEFATFIADLLHAEPIVQDDGSFCVEGEKITVVFDPDLEFYHVHFCHTTKSNGKNISSSTTIGNIIDYLKENKFI